ncbi:acyl-CoA-binding domain-containing protein 4 isoform X2 [Protopterus annectens]|uniref:acyl-CoA-binding domain-containing protein 4 isoform X2 n=1 Tax=Protopterus annectens TaxID=7888 RepID=UPI001CFC31FF|nr:acyl-CoA-binding domain-containing protein 4 isoform X2 [Protopterus annectens]
METTDAYQQFQAAVRVIQSLPPKGCYHPSYEMMLRFYGFYKQATIGPCNIKKPGIWDPVGQYKCYLRFSFFFRLLCCDYTPLIYILHRDAWNKLGDMSKEDAMKAYVEDMKRVAQEVIDMLPRIENAKDMFQYFESLYEVITDMPRPPASYFKEKAATLKGTMMGNPDTKVNDSVDKATTVELFVQQKNSVAKEALVEEAAITSDSESELYCDSPDQEDQEKACSVLTNQTLALKTYISSAEQHSKMSQESSGKGAEEVKAVRAVKDTVPFLEVAVPRSQWAETEVPDNAPHQGRDKRGNSSSVGVGLKEAHTGKCPHNLQEEIVAAVYRLEADMQNVILRLSKLEELVMSQMFLQNSSKWWLPDVHMRKYLFLVFWPFVVHWLQGAFHKVETMHSPSLYRSGGTAGHLYTQLHFCRK